MTHTFFLQVLLAQIAHAQSSIEENLKKVDEVQEQINDMQRWPKKVLFRALLSTEWAHCKRDLFALRRPRKKAHISIFFLNNLKMKRQRHTKIQLLKDFALSMFYNDFIRSGH